MGEAKEEWDKMNGRGMLRNRKQSEGQNWIDLFIGEQKGERKEVKGRKRQLNRVQEQHIIWSTDIRY